MKLIEVQPLIDIISLSLQSAFVKNEQNGISLILISAPETAKTSSIFNFANLNFVGYYDEVTQKRLLDDFLPQVKAKQKRTLLIPDLINCIEKQRSTREQFLSIIKSGIDDTGIMKIETYHKHFDLREIGLMKEIRGLRFNLITAITATSFNMIKRKLIATGLLSRFLPFTYQYPIDKVMKIFKMIETERGENSVTIPKINKQYVTVKCRSRHLTNFQVVSQNLGRQYEGYGIRAHIMFRRLLKASALLDKRKETENKDVDRIMGLVKWINFDFNPL